MDLQYIYKAKVIDVYDGDTITSDIEVGFDVKLINAKIRLKNVFAPEIRGKERPAGLVVRDYLRSLILFKTVLLHCPQWEKGKYGRYLADVWLNNELINTKINAFIAKRFPSSVSLEKSPLRK